MRAVAARLVPTLLVALTPFLLASPAWAAPAQPPPFCLPLDVGCIAGKTLDAAASGVLNMIAQAVTDAVGNAVKSLTTMWVNVGTPQLAAGSVADWLHSELAFYTGGLAVLSVLIGAARMAFERRSQPGNDLAKGLFTLMVVNSCGIAVIVALVAAGDAFAVWIIDQSTGGTDFGTNITAMLSMAAISGVGVILVILLGIVALIGSLVQIVLMVGRGGLLVVMAGVLPTSASFTNTTTGRHWYQRTVGWTAAFILYKPAAAIIYGVAFRLTGQHVFGTDGLTSVLTGLLMMVLALFALPALMRLAVPATATLASAGGGAAGGALVGGLVATGAQVVQMRGSGGGGAGPGWGPSGAGPSGSTPPPSPAGPAGPTGATAAGGAGGAGTAGASGAAGAAGPAGAAVGAAVQAGQAAAGAIRGVADKASGGTEQ